MNNFFKRVKEVCVFFLALTFVTFQSLPSTAFARQEGEESRIYKSLAPFPEVVERYIYIRDPLGRLTRETVIDPVTGKVVSEKRYDYSPDGTKCIITEIKDRKVRREEREVSPDGKFGKKNWTERTTNEGHLIRIEYEYPEKGKVTVSEFRDGEFETSKTMDLGPDEKLGTKDDKSLKKKWVDEEGNQITEEYSDDKLVRKKIVDAENNIYEKEIDPETGETTVTITDHEGKKVKYFDSDGNLEREETTDPKGLKTVTKIAEDGTRVTETFNDKGDLVGKQSFDPEGNLTEQTKIDPETGITTSLKSDEAGKPVTKRRNAKGELTLKESLKKRLLDSLSRPSG